jgi:hypothetical protein
MLLLITDIIYHSLCEYTDFSCTYNITAMFALWCDIRFYCTHNGYYQTLCYVYKIQCVLGLWYMTSVCPSLSNLGMISSVLFHDLQSDLSLFQYYIWLCFLRYIHPGHYVIWCNNTVCPIVYCISSLSYQSLRS